MMKLFTRYNRINLLTTVVIFLLASLVFYFFLRRILVQQVDEDLGIKQTEITTYISRYQHLPEVVQQEDQQIFYRRATRPQPLIEKHHRNGYKTITAKAGQEDLRQLIFTVQLPDGWWAVTVSKSLEGTDHLTWSVVLIALGTVLLMLAVSFSMNRLVLRRLWRPFYDTLVAVQQFRLGQKEVLQLPESSTEEFAVMNRTLQQAMQKAGQDYVLLKEFTENASHELQTPLAVIRSKLELLMQYNLDEPQSRALQSAGEALKSLIRLNKSLLLLAKIQNHQFDEKEEVDVKKAITDKLFAFEELFAAKEILVEPALKEVQLQMNADLANVLLNNLLSNAVKHNLAGGRISISLQPAALVVSNTGAAAALDESRLFTRFYNPAGAENSVGLGLSIVQQICEVSGFSIYYKFEKGLHRFTVSF